jgi:nucleoside-diphosphate-sugar epimerase
MDINKKVFIVGGTGFIGYHSVLKLSQKGYKVTVLSRKPPSKEMNFPNDIKFVQGDLYKLSADELANMIKGHNSVIFAAGADDRVVPKKPAYEFFYRANVDCSRKFFEAAKKVGVKKGVTLSSYFCHFNAKWPECKLAYIHPYIKSRVEQGKVIFDICKGNIDVAVLELPYVFGSMPVRKPLWCPLIKYLKLTPIVFYSKGGTNIVGIKTVADSIVGAIEHCEGYNTYQIGDLNISWTGMIEKINKALGQSKKVVSLPTFLLKAGVMFLKIKNFFEGKEAGLDHIKFLDIQARETFFDTKIAQDALHVTPSNINEVIEDTVSACQ